MKTHTQYLAASFAFLLTWGLAPLHAVDRPAETDYPYAIPTELGATEFATGDSIVITALRGDREHLEPGGHYLLTGTYTLASADEADLAWFATTRGPSGPTPIADRQHVRIHKGANEFRLEKTLSDDGWLHVSFYVNGSASGGVYFGEKGVEATVLRPKGWSNLAVSEARSTGTRRHDIAAYLGNPVSAPSGLDAALSPTSLIAAFIALCQKQGIQVKSLSVDDSEFPFLIYGLLSGKPDFRGIEGALHQTPDYEYGGSVVGSTDAGATYFSLNMIPSSKLPSVQAQACHRRLMIRLQMLADEVEVR